MGNVEQFPTYVNDFLSQFDKIKASDLKDEENLAKMIGFRAKYKLSLIHI